MSDRLVVATEALADGSLTRRDLNRRYTKVHRNVYVRRGVELTALDRARAAWLWSDRHATLVGHSAATLLGSRWIPDDAPVEVVHSRRPPANGITVRTYELRDDEVCRIDGIACTTAARTAYDLGRLLPLETAVIRVDALLNATSATPRSVDDVARWHHGARGVRRLQTVMDLVDAGAESPQETRLRLLLVQSGLLRPVTQIPVTNEHGRVVRRIDMGWPEWKVGAEYDGEQHWRNPVDHANDIDRLEFLAAKGWLIVRVSARQLRYERPRVVERVRLALQVRGCPA
ncbi:MAG: endonuclease domain-containing protein [Mycobacterium sp.]